MSDLLCFHTSDYTYGIPLEYVIESFVNQKITKIPRLHHAFKGLCNHNGIIYPVLSFAGLGDGSYPSNKSCMLLVHIDKYQLVLQVDDTPFIVYESDILKKVPYNVETNNIKIAQLCQFKDEHIYVLDMKKILDVLSENILE